MQTYKYLGLHRTSDLSWSIHIVHVINNANQMVGFLRTHSLIPLSSFSRNHWFKRSLSMQPSSGTPARNTSFSHSIQNQSACFILSIITSNATLMKLSLPNLALCRQLSQLSLFHRIHYHSVQREILLTAPPWISRRLYPQRHLPCNTHFSIHS